MKKSVGNTFLQAPALRRLAAGVMLCCAVSTLSVPALAQEPSAAGAALNFVNADMESVIKAIGHYTGMTFIIDPRVKGTLTLVSEKPLSKSQAFQLLTSALRVQGFAVVTGDGYAKVVPEAEAKLQASPTQVGRQPRAKGDQIVTQVFRLNYESAANLTAVLRPLISPNNSIMANPGNNSLVITDYADNLRRLAKIIAALDSPPGADLDVVPVRYAVASDVAAMVNRLMEPAPGGDSGRVTVLADPRTNSVVVRAPSAARANLAKSLVAKLDQPTAEAGNVHVVYLKNADATRLAQTLRAVVSSDTSLPATQQGTAGGSVASGTQGGGTAGQQGQQGGGTLGGGGGSSLNPQSPGQTLGGGGGATGAGFIQADASTNTLIITASEAVYRNLRAVIDQLDVRRAQVYIEALIVEVNAAKASEFGVQWLAASGDSSSRYRVGGIQNFNATTGNGLATLIAGKGAVPPGPGISIGLFRQINGQLGLGAVAHALESDNSGNILSTPNMLTLDNELSTIKVGQNVPIISGQFTTTGGTNTNPFQTIDRRDVGLTLKVRPQISEGGTIKLAIYNESSSVVAASKTDPAGVTTDIRIIENNVLADDGQIIVLGGLIKDDSSGAEEKVPGLGSIPIIGNLFKYQSRARTKTNLMVFLRPVIVRSKEDSRSIALDRYDYMRSSGIDAQPRDTTLLVKELGSPVLPVLSNGQPPPGSTMAAVPPKPVTAPAPAPGPGLSAPASPGSTAPARPGAPAPAPGTTPDPSGVYRPVQKQ
jgi:general secretion pathway protein D